MILCTRKQYLNYQVGIQNQNVKTDVPILKCLDYSSSHAMRASVVSQAKLSKKNCRYNQPPDTSGLLW